MQENEKKLAECLIKGGLKKEDPKKLADRCVEESYKLMDANILLIARNPEEFLK